MFTPQLQIVSDLHLETPISSPSYHYRLEVQASNLCLLGDIGLIQDSRLFVWLERCLKITPNLRVFFVIGNHKPYGITLEQCREKMKSFSSRMRKVYRDRLHLLDRTRYDLSPTVTILGCTLWTAVEKQQANEVQLRRTDFNQTRGIKEWPLADHLREHQTDLQWLNEEVSQIEIHEPNRQAVILTHHSPTKHSLADNPEHQGSSVSSGFVSDLSSQICWTSSVVKVWAFGHTHYSCNFSDDSKLVVSNQKGYSTIDEQSESKVFVIEQAGDRWFTLQSASKSKKKSECSSAVKKTTEHLQLSHSAKLSLSEKGFDRFLGFFKTMP
jgi:predicted phosphodiesterase